MTRTKTKKTTRIFATIMAVVLLAMCLPMSVFGASEDFSLSDITGVTESTAGDAGGVSVSDSGSAVTGDVIGEYVEDVSRREENVKHFALPDGTYTAIVYPTAVHRKDSNGVWQDIDNDLSLATVKGSRKYATSDARVSFSQNYAASNELMTLSENGYTISMSLLRGNDDTALLSTESVSLTSPIITNAVKKELPKTDVKLEDVARIDNKSSIIYSNVKANTDIEYILDGNAVKENIIARAAASRYEYTFELNLTGLVATLESDGSIAISDAATSTQKYEIPAPYMYDANGELSYAVEYTLIELSSGRYLLAVTADETWINATGRAFPVTIDPTIVPDTMMSDTYVSQSSPNTSYFGSANLLVDDDCIALMLFDYPELPIGASLDNAYLYMNYYFDSSSADAIEVGAYEITSSWNETLTTYNNMPSISSEALSTTILYGDMGTETSPYMVQMSITDALANWYYEDIDNYGIAIEYLSGTGTAKIKSYDSGYNTCEFISVTYSVTYASADLAAMAFATKMYASSLYIRHECATIIYKVTENGNTLYFYTTPVFGEPHGVSLPIDLVPSNGTMVAYSHTHPNSNEFSSTDITVANRLEIDGYFNGPNLQVKKFNHTTGQYPIYVGTITPTPLTYDQKQELRADFYDSWQDHITNDDCGFGCASITWPTP